MILAAFSLHDTNHHSLAIDVQNLEAGHLGDPQTGRVSCHQDHAVLLGTNFGEEPADFLHAEDDRKMPLGTWAADV